jgi:hypothetical protein
MIARYHDRIRDTLEVELSDHSWLQASLPVSAGELGIRKASQIVLPVFPPSVVGSVDLFRQILPSLQHSSASLQEIHFTAACDLWKTRTPAAPHFVGNQKFWDSPLVGAFLHAVHITA